MAHALIHPALTLRNGQVQLLLWDAEFSDLGLLLLLYTL